MAVTEVFLVFVEEAFSKDLQFREMASQGKDLSGFKEFPHSEQSYLQSQTRTKPYETEKSTRAIEENARDYGMGLSM